MIRPRISKCVASGWPLEQLHECTMCLFGHLVECAMCLFEHLVERAMCVCDQLVERAVCLCEQIHCSLYDCVDLFIGSLQPLHQRAHADARAGDGAPPRAQPRRPLSLVLRLQQLRPPPRQATYTQQCSPFIYM